VRGVVSALSLNVKPTQWLDGQTNRQCATLTAASLGDGHMWNNCFTSFNTYLHCLMPLLIGRYYL